MMKGGTIVDATIINAPSSTKNAEKARDPEMHQTKKGNEWRFGMKCHIGVDAGSGYVHTITATSANVHDITPTHELLREDDEVVYGDAGYIGVGKSPEIAENEHFKDIDLRITRRPKSLPKVSDNAIDWERYIDHPEAAPIVRNIFEMRASGISPHHIADKLNEDGVPIPSDYYYAKLGKPNPRRTRHMWSPETVRQILHNYTYLGHLVQLRTKTVSY